MECCIPSVECCMQNVVCGVRYAGKSAFKVRAKTKIMKGYAVFQIKRPFFCNLYENIYKNLRCRECAEML